MRRFISFIVIFISIVSLILFPIGVHYKNMLYNYSFDEILTYEDLFFSVDSSQYSIYGIGSYDIYADRLIEKELNIISGEPPHSNTEESYVRKGVELYPEFLIKNRNDILSKCTFKKVSNSKSILLSFLFNRLNNITTIRINKGYLSPKLNDGRFTKEILQDILDKGNGITNAGVFHLFDKTYLMADYTIFSNVDVNEYSYKGDAIIKKFVFEILPSETTDELVEIKYSSQASYVDSYKTVPIKSWNILLIFVVYVSLRKWLTKTSTINHNQ